MNQYKVLFEFTTVTKSGRFMGRNGYCYVESELTLLEVHKDLQELQSLCAEFIKMRKPKWNIFMIDVVSAIPVSVPKEL